MEGYYNIKEIVEQYVAGCKKKTGMSIRRVIGRAFIAGMMIALGAGISSVAAHTIKDVGLARMAAAVVFPVGLMMVILLGAELFTGDCLFSLSVFEGKQKVKDFVRLLTLVYIGNFIGAAMIAVMIFMTGQWDYSSGMLGAYTIKVALSKVNLSFTQAFVSGILCNILVCAAVLMVMSSKDATGKLLATFFVIMLFVIGGFEHCVANMYYITAGLLAKTNSTYMNLAMDVYGFSGEYLATLNLKGFLITNMLPVTLGNVIGGTFFMGAPIYYFNRRRVKPEDENANK